MKNARHHIGILLFVLLQTFCGVCWAMEGEFPAWYETTTRLNVRGEDNANSRLITTLEPNILVLVEYMTENGWAAIDYGGGTYYVNANYITYYKDAVADNNQGNQTSNQGKSSSKGFWSWVFTIVGWTIVFVLIRKVAIYILGFLSLIMYRAYWVLCIPFYMLNWLQRYLSKPWRMKYKKNSGRDYENAELREKYENTKIPLYIVLTPLRFVNALYFNMFVHCSFEMFNYAIEVFMPSNEKEGADNDALLVVLAPWRFLRYVVFHGGLTIIESGIWTIIDTFVPALTLFHGTDAAASTTITNAGRDGYSCNLTGIWNVGNGNYAGNGIYFAPARSTALHYACGSLIVCRVTLGKVLDLGLAPWSIYKQCGYPNATGATQWGLQHGYVTGEWWRGDRDWWEYCMYDWQNRYNYSWRIRPLYVLNLEEKFLQRIPGGMCHWLFRKMVIDDILNYWEKL